MLHDDRLKYDKFCRIQLLQYRDFPEEWDYDEYCLADFPRAHIEFQLRPLETEGLRVEKISIVYADPKSEGPVVQIDPLTLLREGFDDRFDPDVTTRTLAQLSHNSVLNSAKHRLGWTRKDYIPSVYGRHSFATYAQNVWEEYCLFEGTASLARSEFDSWIYRFTSLTTDLIDFPFSSDSDWQERVEILKLLASDPLGLHYECFSASNWDPLLEQSEITASAADRARLSDACITIEKFRLEVEREYPLGQFLHSIVDAFAKYLVDNRRIKECAFCPGYFPYDDRKVFCSLKSEHRDCGRRARNRRNYLNRSEEQKERNRQGNRELRLFYKKKGIKKRRPY